MQHKFWRFRAFIGIQFECEQLDKKAICILPWKIYLILTKLPLNKTDKIVDTNYPKRPAFFSTSLWQACIKLITTFEIIKCKLERDEQNQNSKYLNATAAPSLITKSKLFFVKSRSVKNSVNLHPF